MFGNIKKNLSSAWMLPIVTLILAPLPIISYVFFDISPAAGYFAVLISLVLFVKVFHSGWLLPIAIVLIPILQAISYIVFGIPMEVGYGVIAVFAIGLLLWAFCLTKKPLFLSLIVSGTILAILFYFKDEEGNVAMRLQIRLEPKFLACEKTGESIGGKGVISVCARHINLYGQEFDTIIYDSTDEIIANASGRSETWKAVAISLGNKAPFGILGFTAERITGHYYHVVFDVANQANKNL